MQKYSGAVPAVQKTIAVLEHLRSAATAPTLTELAQALRLNRSSLLAVLNTLRAAGYVTRDGADRYHLGPALLPYAAALARGTGLLEAFDQAGEWLAEAAGESVALTRLAGGEAVCLAFKPGRHAVRVVAEPGQTWPASHSAAALAILGAARGATRTASRGERGACADDMPALELASPNRTARRGVGLDGTLKQALAAVRTCGCAYVEDGGEPGQAALAAPVCDASGEVVAAVELLAPAYRLGGGSGPRTAGRLVIAAARQVSLALGCSDYAPYRPAAAAAEPWRGSGAAGLHGSELEAFLARPWLASLACLRENGYPYTVPVWYEWRDGAFWLAPRAGARWAGYIQGHPQVSMTISEAAPPFRRVLVEGLAGPARASAAALVKRLAERYLGAYAASYLATNAGRHRLTIRVAPDKLTSWEGLVARAPARRAS